LKSNGRIVRRNKLARSVYKIKTGKVLGRIMRRFIMGFGIGLLSSVAIIVTAGQVDNNNITSFVPGTVLNATDLNTNTQALISAINDNASQLPLNFAQYVNTHLQKDFIVRDVNGVASNCLLRRTYVRTSIANGTQIKRAQSRIDPNDAAAGCNALANGYTVFEVTPDAYKMTGTTRDNFDINGNPVTETYNLLDPITVFYKNMRLGASSGGASVSTVGNISGMSIQQFFIVDILSVVPNVQVIRLDNSIANYPQCISIRDSHNNSSYSVSWFCQGVGLVKRIASTGEVWELQSYTN